MTSMPRPTWVHPALLGASCISADADDEGTSQWLRRGTHLRVFPSSHIGYPVCPFTVWHAGGVSIGDEVLGGSGDYLSTGLGADALLVAGWANGGSLSVVDAGGRATGRRSYPKPLVSRVPLPGLRYSGSGSAYTSRYEDGLQVDDETGESSFPRWLGAEPIDAIGAPLPEGAWWCGVDDGYTSSDLTYRVTEGLPDIAQPYDAFQPADAYGRAQAMAVGLEPDVAAAWAEPASGTPPAGAQLQRGLEGNKGAQAVLGMNLGLWAATVDPASARWWGFATTLPVTATVSSEWAECFAVAALFVLHPTGRNDEVIKLARETQADPMAQPFTDRLYDAHANRNLQQVADEIRGEGHEVVCLWTIVVATPPPDIPDAPGISVPAGRKVWNDDQTWNAAVAIHGPAAGPLAALRDPDVPLNQLVNPDEPWRLPIVAPAATDDPTAVTLADSSCPPGPASWQVATADMWGQWSAFGAGGSDPPDLPPVPTPTVVFECLTAAPAPGSAPASPGDVVVRVTVPPPPSPAPPITWVEAIFTAGVPPGYGGLDDQGGGVWTGQMPVSPTTPGGWAYLSCRVTAADANNRRSSIDATTVMYDPRPFVAPLTSGVLLFSGERRPDGLAELDVRAPLPPAIPPGVTWRCYATDEQILDPPPARDEPRWSRANRLRASIDASPTRAHMAPLTNARIESSGGELHVRAQLPGRLESVQVVQLVATSSTGLEAPSSSSGSFAVAVPLSDTPPTPTLTGEIDEGGTDVSLTAILTYPGTRPDGDAPPWPIARRSGTAATSVRARIRRSASGRDPSTWPVIAVVDLAPDNLRDSGAGWRWTAVVSDALPAPTPAWSPLSYVCEVAWPAEPAWNPAATPVFGAVHATWSSAAAQPSVWSAASTAVTVRAPRPIVAVLPTYVDNLDGTATITVAVPTAHPRAPRWTLTAMADPATGLPPVTVAGFGPTLGLDVDATVAAARWLLAVVTPAGTTLPIVAADGTTPP
jgi:hypothetical protein